MVKAHGFYDPVQRAVITNECPWCRSMFSARLGAQHHACSSFLHGFCRASGSHVQTQIKQALLPVVCPPSTQAICLILHHFAPSWKKDSVDSDFHVHSKLCDCLLRVEPESSPPPPLMSRPCRSIFRSGPSHPPSTHLCPHWHDQGPTVSSRRACEWCLPSGKRTHSGMTFSSGFPGFPELSLKLGLLHLATSVAIFLVSAETWNLFLFLVAVVVALTAAACPSPKQETLLDISLPLEL